MRNPEQEVSVAVKFLLQHPVSKENLRRALKKWPKLTPETLRPFLLQGSAALPDTVQPAFLSPSQIYADRLLEAWKGWLEVILDSEFEPERTIQPFETNGRIHNSFDDPDPRN